MAKGDGAIYRKLGVRPFINGLGNNTWVGGRNLPAVQEAIESAGSVFVDVVELQAAVGERIAELLGVDAALPTPGCAAAVMFSAAGCMAGDDPAKQRRIPDTTGMKNEVVLQRAQANEAHRMYEVPGATLVYAGRDTACTQYELAQAIGAKTAALGFELQPTWGPDVLPIDAVVEVAHRAGVPVIVDAASKCDPPGDFVGNARSADLVCFGGKYFGGPNNAGFVCGGREHVARASAHSFMGESMAHGFMPWGRGHKLDRIALVALAAALEAWLAEDPADRRLRHRRRAEVITQAVAGIAGVTTAPTADSNGIDVLLSSAVAKTAEQVAGELDVGEPRIKVAAAGNCVSIRVFAMNAGDENIVAERLRGVLGG